MKKILLSLVAAAGIASSANAQLASGTVFPDFTVTDINGMSHNLYSDLNSGKTVFIDISATWCGPCWSYHISGKLDSIWAKHGPAGEPGVDATTTNDAVVYFFQGEPTSGMAELTNNAIGSGAVTTGGTAATFTQGDWVAGTHYYIIDDSTAQGPRNTLWNINYFPTIYMICRDHIVTELTQPTEAEAYAAAQATCPSTPPASGSSVDAKTSAYGGNNYFVCNAAPSVTFQNYSTTSNITSATITVTDATGATVATVPWSGSLAPYAVQSVSIPSFAGTSFGGYKYNVTVSGDINTANNISLDSVFKVYTAANAAALPGTENFEGSTISYKEDFSSDGYVFPVTSTAFAPTIATMIGSTGAATNALLFFFFRASAGQVSEYVFNNFNTASAGTYNLQFDVAYQQYDASTNDALAVKVSTDCGATWSTVWNQNGSALATLSAYNTSIFAPTTAASWKHVTVDMSAYHNANTLVKFVGTSAYGNDAFVDNVSISAGATGVANVNMVNMVSITPNPAKDMAYVNMSITEATAVQINVYDAMGRVVNTIGQELSAGDQKIEISTANLAAGIYTVKIIAGTDITTKTLSVIK